MFQLHGEEGPIGNRQLNLESIIAPMLEGSMAMVLTLRKDGYDGVLHRTAKLLIKFKIIKF